MPTDTTTKTSEFVMIAVRLPSDEDHAKACELLREAGYDVYRSWRQGT